MDSTSARGAGEAGESAATPEPSNDVPPTPTKSTKLPRVLINMELSKQTRDCQCTECNPQFRQNIESQIRRSLEDEFERSTKRDLLETDKGVDTKTKEALDKIAHLSKKSKLRERVQSNGMLEL